MLTNTLSPFRDIGDNLNIQSSGSVKSWFSHIVGLNYLWENYDASQGSVDFL
jgi:hypothetical protein